MENSVARNFERQYLRSEIESNKKLVLERALLIAGVGLAATLVPKDAKGIELLGLPAIGALAFNLWFTVNRLTSSSRIIAYIQLFHEFANDLVWIGWENALRLARIWSEECEHEKKMAEKRFATIPQYDNLSFYGPILALHIAMAVAIAGLMSFRAWVHGPTKTPDGDISIFSYIGLNFAAATIFSLWALITCPPKKLLYGIEKNRILWMAVIKSYTNGELRKVLENEPPEEKPMNEAST